MSDHGTGYKAICDAAWALYESQIDKLTSAGKPRNFLFPPPYRGRRVDVLVVGISPNQCAPIGYSNSRIEMEAFAHEFTYVREAGHEDSSRYYDEYYGALMTILRRIHPDLGVWPQVQGGEKRFLVEFTDCLHIATTPGEKDDLWKIFKQPVDRCAVWKECKDILELELKLHQPRVVIGNGRQPSDMLWEICRGSRKPGTPEDSVILNARFGCNVHLSGFLTGQSMDGYSKARFVREVKQLSPL